MHVINKCKMFMLEFEDKNKTNHEISSNSHPSATAIKVIQSLKRGGGLQNQLEHHIILTKYET